MKHAYVRFYGELNDFLPLPSRGVTVEHRFQGKPSVKDVIESLGVPHTEVDLILVNGTFVDFSAFLQEGVRISVYPTFTSLDTSSLRRVRPALPSEARFVLDTHLGRLATYLRMMGFDSLYGNNYTDGELAHISRDEHRVLLTRDRGLLKRGIVTYGYYVREAHPRQQLLAILRHFELARSVSPFSRCMECNTPLQRVPKEQINDRLQPTTRKLYDCFHICPSCERIYWKGAHCRRMQQLIDGVMKHINSQSADDRV